MSSLIITSVAPNIVSRAGGDKVVVTGVFPQGVVIAPTLTVQEHSDPLYIPYSGISGQGSGVLSINGTTLTFFTPRVDDETALSFLLTLTATGFTSATLASALSLRQPFFFSQVYSMRSVMPPKFFTGPRNFENEEPVQ